MDGGMSFDYNRLSNMIKYKMCVCVFGRVFTNIMTFFSFFAVSTNVKPENDNLKEIS